MNERFPIDMLAGAEVEEKLQFPLARLAPIVTGLNDFRRAADGVLGDVRMELNVGTADAPRIIKVTRTGTNPWLLEF